MANKLKDTTEIIAQIKEYIGQGGMVAFEHGFHYPRFKMQGYTSMCTHLSDKVLYGYNCSCFLLLHEKKMSAAVTQT